MKTQEHRIEDLSRGRSEAQLESTVGALFRRCPALCGFSVHHSGRLCVSEITVDPRAAPLARGLLCEQIVIALAELIDECPEACELLCERTFARTLH